MNGFSWGGGVALSDVEHAGRAVSLKTERGYPTSWGQFVSNCRIEGDLPVGLARLWGSDRPQTVDLKEVPQGSACAVKVWVGEDGKTAGSISDTAGKGC